MAGISRDVCIALILRYIGGTPLRGAVNVRANKLLVARKVGFGDLGGLTDTVLADGLGSVFRSPLAGMKSALQGAISGAVAQLKEHFRQTDDDGGGEGSSIMEAEPDPDDDGATYPPEIVALIEALEGESVGLSGAVRQVDHAANLLSGVQLPGDFEFGLADLLSLALDGSETLFERASRPLEQLPRLTKAHTFVATLAQQVITGEITPERATAIIQDHASTLRAVVSASNAALAAMRNGAEAVALVQEAAAALMDSAMLNAETSRAKVLVETIVRPEPLETMRQVVHDWTHPTAEDD